MRRSKSLVVGVGVGRGSVGKYCGYKKRFPEKNKIKN